MKNSNYKIPYINLGKQHNFYVKPFQASLKKFLKSGQFILGEYVSRFSLPWYYIPLWIGITTPLTFILFFFYWPIANLSTFF